MKIYPYKDSNLKSVVHLPSRARPLAIVANKQHRKQRALRSHVAVTASYRRIYSSGQSA